MNEHEQDRMYRALVGRNSTAALELIVSAWEGCIGIAKNLQSVDALLNCGRQLQHYIRSLLPAA